MAIGYVINDNGNVNKISVNDHLIDLQVKDYDPESNSQLSELIELYTEDDISIILLIDKDKVISPISNNKIIVPLYKYFKKYLKGNILLICIDSHGKIITPIFHVAVLFDFFYAQINQGNVDFLPYLLHPGIKLNSDRSTSCILYLKALGCKLPWLLDD